MKEKERLIFLSYLKESIIFLLLIISIPLGVLTQGGVDTYWVIIPLVFLMQGYLIFCFKNTQMLIILTLYVFIYFLYLLPYFYGGIQLSQYSQFQNRLYFSNILFLFYLFYTGLLLASKKKVELSGIKLIDKIHIKTSTIGKSFYLLMLFFLLILTLRQGENVLANASNSYEIYKQNLDNTNSLPLFMVLLLLFFPSIINRNKIGKLCFIVVNICMAYFCITRGMRMILAPLGMLIFSFYFDNKIKIRSLLLLFIAGFLVLVFINALKMNMNFQAQNILSEGGDNDFIISHHADNLYVASAGIGLVKQDIITFWDRVMLNIGFVAETLVPPSWLSNNLKYPHIITKFLPTGGGGLCIVGAYLMWGYVGVICFGYLLGCFICSSYKKNSSLQALICSVLLVFFPRWISYDFHIILRFSFLALVLYFVLSWPIKKKYS